MNTIFILSILLLIFVPFILIIGFIENLILLSIILSALYLILGILFFKVGYPQFLVKNRKSIRWCKTLSDEELELVDDAKELIKSVDNKIIISNFNVYKVRFLMHGWFNYDKDTQELSIFIPFKFLLSLGGKDLCFLAVLHEVLHSQNLKNGVMIFNTEFLEGLNQLLTIWLIDNYSKKYKISNGKCFSVRLKKDFYLDLHIGNWKDTIYEKEVNIVNNILQKSNLDLKQVFLNYVDIQPEFFKSFVPLNYFKEQK